MRMKNANPAHRRGRSAPTNVSLDVTLVAEARELGVNISQASARGLEQAVAAARAIRWAAENQAAITSSNAFVEEHGLPLQSLRQF
jgi:antitoxin CcdA